MENETQQAETQSFLQRWAPYIGALGVALVVAAVFLGYMLPTQRTILLLVGGVGIILIAIFLFTRPREELREAVTGRTTLYSTNSLVMALAFIGIVLAINWIVANPLSDRLHGRWDLTANKQYTLSEQTLNVLKNLSEPVQVTGFFTPQSLGQEMDAENLLKEYQLKSSKFTYHFIDPVANPAAAKSYDIAQDSTLVFERGTRQEKIYTFDESSFTNAILKVTQTQQPAIYFTTGHGEMNPTDTNQSGLSSIRDYLQQTNYKVDVLNLSTITSTQTISGGMPADISALVIADPQKPFASADEVRIKTYLQNGGRVLLMVNPQSDPGLKDLLSSYGITLTNDLVLDPAMNYRGFAAYPAVTSFPSHQVTSNLQGYGVFFPGVRSLKQAGPTSDTVTALFTTSDQACDKTNLAALQNEQQLQCDPSKDGKGPFVMGYAVETPAKTTGGKPSRLIVMGNANFASNQIMQSQDGEGNRLLVVNMINWLAGQEQLIAIPPKAPGTHPLKTMTNEDTAFVALSNVALIPLTILIIGALIWWRRR